ncbi:unnamed protein product [Clonostachys rosea]|uniref:Short-chain dehydrogenase n=1 Tax=Bionectria ochroleuca TaxID=29856 RepID=A0ABY6UYQ3_BIOOC|nr:unnamed protein product [Clonostachys rosea]
MPSNSSVMKQFFCPSKPQLTVEHLPDLTDKVMIVTGSNTGLGKEIAQALYSKNARVYMMARSENKTKEAIESIKTNHPNSKGELRYIHLDLSDLTTIKSSVDQFLQKEQSLHLLYNNAGVGYPEKGSKTKQGYELQLGVNCVGPFLFTKLLMPTLVSTAKLSPKHSVRIAWVSSSAAESFDPELLMGTLPKIDDVGQLDQYNVSKMGNYLHACEFARQYKESRVLSVSLNPGALDSDFWRSQGKVTLTLLRSTVLHPPIYGAYTALFAGFTPQITSENSGSYVAPWGKIWKLQQDMLDAAKTKEEGGTGVAKSFWDWSEEQVKLYV